MKKIESLDTMVRDFLEGRLSPKKRTLFLQFIRKSRDTSKLSEIHASLFDQIQQLSEEELIQLQNVLKREKEIAIRPLWLKLVPYAAAVLCIGAFLFSNQYKVDTTDFYTVLNSKETTDTVRLEDGTEVILKGKSSISDVSFTQTERTLTLTGDAYFKVKPNSTPFSVRTESGYHTRVLGTQFEVQTAENRFMVNVDKGRVFVSKGESELAVLQK
ncbi:MAG: FecR domain-containing protein, partial [Sphingobacterium sp.]|nr:FecR domain-containing protein [Sphingobacterium sp.]